MYLKSALLCFLTVGIMCESVSGALLAYEGFDYPNDGPGIVGRTGGSGWSGGWIDSDEDFNLLSQDDVSLDSTAFPFTPIGDRVAAVDGPGETGGVAAREFDTSINLENDGEVLFASFLFRKENDGGTSKDNVEFDLGNSSKSKVIRFGSTSGDDFFMRLGSGNAPGTGAVPLGETQFVVLKLSSSATSDDTLDALIYGPTDSVPTTEPLNWDLSVSKGLSDTLNRVRIQIGDNATGALDEIRLGNSWASVAVVPEPASMALIVLGFGVVAGFRRRY